MERVPRLSLVLILIACLTLFGPLSATAVPVKGMPVTPVEDTPYNFLATDLTDDLATQAGARGVSEVTAVLGFYEEAFIGAKDSNGDAMLFGFNGGVWRDLSAGVSGMKTINDLTIKQLGVDDLYVCAVGDDGTQAMIKAVNLDPPNLTITLTEALFPTITSVSNDWTDDMGLGMTFGESGFALSDLQGIYIKGGDPMENAANAVSWPSDNGPYFLAGTHSGTILEYGAGYGDVYTTLPGVTDILSLNPMFGTDFNLVAGLGTDGYMKLIKMRDETDILELSTPKTITANAGIGWTLPYALVGGTGSASGHLYKWRQQAGEFIDYDYMLTGMTKVNDISSGTDIFGSLPPSSPLAGFWVVGGAGTKKLVVVTAWEFNDSISPDVPSTHECGDGTAVVEFPANSVGEAYNAIVEKVASGTPPVPGGLNLLGTSYEFECIGGTGSLVTEFNLPVTITIYYDDADLNGISEDSLQIYWYNPTSSAWEAVTPIHIDKVNNFCQVQVTHFSQFAIMGMTELPYTGN